MRGQVPRTAIRLGLDDSTRSFALRRPMNEDFTDTLARHGQNRLSIKITWEYEAAGASGWNARVHMKLNNRSRAVTTSFTPSNAGGKIL